MAEVVAAAVIDVGGRVAEAMGWRAAEDLKQNGIQAFIVQADMSPEAAVSAYRAGELGPAGGFCRCHHGSFREG